jgi:protein TonB
MFEGSLVESRGLVVSETQRWTALGSLTLQLAVAGLLIAIPLLRPQVPPTVPSAPPLVMPFLHKPPMPVVTQPETASPAAITMPAAEPAAAAAPGRLTWPHPGPFTDGDGPTLVTDVAMGSGGTGLPAALGLGSSTQPVVVAMRPKPSGPVAVSGGVTEGMLMAPIRPAYPAIARAAGVQGKVVMEAVISKAGRIESLRALSGPEMLRQAAMTAVQAARYRPYLLSGEPVEVQTTITVVFTLGS